MSLEAGLGQPRSPSSARRRRAHALRNMTSLKNETVAYMVEKYINPIREKCMDDEEAQFHKIRMWFAKEWSVYVDHAVSRVQITEMNRRSRIQTERLQFMEKFHAFFRWKEGVLGLPAVEENHWWTSALMWLAEATNRKEINERKLIEITELKNREMKLKTYFEAVFLKPHQVQSGRFIQKKAEQWTEHLQQLEQLRADRMHGIFATQLHDVILQHEASRLRLEWEEETEGRWVRSQVGSQMRKLNATSYMQLETQAATAATMMLAAHGSPASSSSKGMGKAAPLPRSASASSNASSSPQAVTQ